MDNQGRPDPIIITPDERCACLLALDVSGSMSGDPIGALNQGLVALETQLKQDPLAARRVELAIVTFGGRGAQLEQDFVQAKHFDAPTLEAEGQTPMAAAVHLGLQVIRSRKNEYRSSGIQYYRPWFMLMTDGEPTDDGWEEAAAAVGREESKKGLSCFPIGVGNNVNMEKLSRFSKTRPPVPLAGLDFVKLFRWLSESLRVVSESGPGDMVSVPPVQAWAAVEV